VAGWSVRHRKTAVLGWLILVAVIFMAGQALGTRSLPAYDAGQSGRTFAADPAMRQAATQLAGALARLPGAATDIRSPLAARRSPLAARRSPPGTGPWCPPTGAARWSRSTSPARAGKQTDAPAPALRAVTAVQARHPDLRISEGGDASQGRAIEALLDKGFRRAEAISYPITLVLPLVPAALAVLAAGPPGGGTPGRPGGGPRHRG
jgi:RND superfamily putative drug exporter